MTYHPTLEELKQRFFVFTEKLMAKADALEKETLASVQLVYNEDEDHYKRTYNQFKLGIKGQFKSILDKAQDVFNNQIMPLRDSNKYENTAQWFTELQQHMRQFESQIYFKQTSIFDTVEEISPEVHLQQIKEEYERIKDAFHCKQCGANLSIDQIYFVSTYITCPYCQTQNTFVPGSRMQELQHLARDVAEKRLESLQQEIMQSKKDGASRETLVKLYLDYRALVWLEKSKIVPVFKEEYAKVFYREIYEDAVSYNLKEPKIQPLTYEAVLTRLGFNARLKPRVILAYQNKDTDLFLRHLKDWEKLYSLSSFLILKLYRAEEQEALHQKHFKRIQNQWTLMSQLIADLEAQDKSIEEVISIIENKF